MCMFILHTVMEGFVQQWSGHWWPRRLLIRCVCLTYIPVRTHGLVILQEALVEAPDIDHGDLDISDDDSDGSLDRATDAGRMAEHAQVGAHCVRIHTGCHWIPNLVWRSTWQTMGMWHVMFKMFPSSVTSRAVV